MTVAARDPDLSGASVPTADTCVFRRKGQNDRGDDVEPNTGGDMISIRLGGEQVRKRGELG